MSHRLRNLAILVLLGGGIFPSCGNRSAELRADELSAAIRENQLRHFARTFSHQAAELAIGEARTRAHVPSVREVIDAGGLEFEQDERLRQAIVRFYEARNFEPVFVHGSELTSMGRNGLDRLLNVEAEGFDPRDFHLETIKHDADVLASAGDVAEVQARVQIDSAEEQILLQHLLDTPSVDSTLPAVDAIFGVISKHSAGNPLPDFATGVDELTEVLSRLATSGPELELAIAVGVTKYVRENSLENLASVSPEVASAKGWNVADEAQREEIIQARVAEFLDTMAESGEFQETLDGARPPFAQYQSLMGSLADYQEIRTSGGWETVPATPLVQLGRTHENIPAIRRRLSAEGYFDGELNSTTFDQALSDALADYQATHQLGGDGALNEETLTSLNVPLERRIAQIIVALQKWRETRKVADVGRDYIWANIPDFHAELWDKGELIYRWRVVVGRERRVGNRVEGRTPLFSDVMQYVVFNPYWNVPRTIENAEYTKLIEADPTWLATNGFEYYLDDGGTQWLRQVPGPSNALGVVKFLFPNNHFVYMHDTPSKNLFSRPTRAFSHGCVRVENPLDLANVILRRDREMTEGEADAMIRRELAKNGEQWISLRTPVPVHIEYIGVRVDDDGLTNFLADPYRYDRDLVDAVQERLTGQPIVRPEE